MLVGAVSVVQPADNTLITKGENIFYALYYIEHNNDFCTYLYAVH